MTYTYHYSIPIIHLIIFQPHLHTIVNRSMELAMSAKEPYNYFLLLRALFRSIGGGSHDLLYQEFLPLLPNLLQGMFNSLPTSVVCWLALKTVWIQIRTDNCRAWSGSKLFATLMVTLKEFFWKVNFQFLKQFCRRQINHEKFLSMQRGNPCTRTFFHFSQTSLELHVCFTLCLLGNFACFFVVCQFFQNQLFQKFFREYHQNFKQFGYRSGPT